MLPVVSVEAAGVEGEVSIVWGAFAASSSGLGIGMSVSVFFSGALDAAWRVVTVKPADAFLRITGASCRLRPSCTVWDTCFV